MRIELYSQRSKLIQRFSCRHGQGSVSTRPLAASYLVSSEAWRKLTCRITRIVRLPIEQRRQLLEVTLGGVETPLEGAHLLELVGSPLPFVGEAHEREPVVDRVRDGRQQRADRVPIPVVGLPYVSQRRCAWPAALGGSMARRPVPLWASDPS